MKAIAKCNIKYYRRRIENAANKTEELFLEFPGGKLIPINVKAVSMAQINTVTTEDHEKRLYEMVLLMLADKPSGTIDQQISCLKNTLSLSHINAIINKSFSMVGGKFE
jgi:hypothetical protein